MKAKFNEWGIEVKEIDIDQFWFQWLALGQLESKELWSESHGMWALKKWPYNGGEEDENWKYALKSQKQLIYKYSPKFDQGDPTYYKTAEELNARD